MARNVPRVIRIFLVSVRMLVGWRGRELLREVFFPQWNTTIVLHWVFSVGTTMVVLAAISPQRREEIFSGLPHPIKMMGIILFGGLFLVLLDYISLLYDRRRRS